MLNPYKWLVRAFYRTFLQNAIRNEIYQHFVREHLIFGPTDRLICDPSAVVQNAFFNTVSGTITIDRDVFFGHSVHILTGTHDYHQFGQARQDAYPTEGRPVVLEQGAWIGTGAIVIGPCVVGAHAVVAAGAVVTANVAPYTIVAGVPARLVKEIARDQLLPTISEARA